MIPVPNDNRPRAVNLRPSLKRELLVLLLEQSAMAHEMGLLAHARRLDDLAREFQAAWDEQPQPMTDAEVLVEVGLRG